VDLLKNEIMDKSMIKKYPIFTNGGSFLPKGIT